MYSPDGNIEVVRVKNFSKNVSIWIGWIEIPDHRFLLRGRKFTDKMLFSPNSRFLALTEFCAKPLQSSRVVVLDFLTRREVKAYDEEFERLEDREIVTSLHWVDGSTLRIGTASSDISKGERIRVWKAT